jgi:hypothetical protein
MLTFKEIPLDKPFAIVEGDFVKILIKQKDEDDGEIICRSIVWDGKVSRVSTSVAIKYPPEWDDKPVLMVEGNVSYK